MYKLNSPTSKVLTIVIVSAITIGSFVAVLAKPSPETEPSVLSETSSATPEESANQPASSDPDDTNKKPQSSTSQPTANAESNTSNSSGQPTSQPNSTEETVIIEEEELEINISGWEDDELGSEFEL